MFSRAGQGPHVEVQESLNNKAYISCILWTFVVSLHNYLYYFVKFTLQSIHCKFTVCFISLVIYLFLFFVTLSMCCHKQLDPFILMLRLPGELTVFPFFICLQFQKESKTFSCPLWSGVLHTLDVIFIAATVIYKLDANYEIVTRQHPFMQTM